MQPSAFFHDASGAVRFWVLAEGGGFVGASIAKEVLHYRFRADRGGSDALPTYLAHREEIDAAVLRRLAKGSLEPVMLREIDVAVVPEQ
jgi:hypothetical protein